MSDTDELTRFLLRADRLATVFDIRRALEAWDKKPRDTVGPEVTNILSNQENMRVARLLARQLGPAKNTLLGEFGRALDERLSENRIAVGAEPYWKLVKDYHTSWTKMYAGRGLIQQIAQDPWKIPGVYVCIQRTQSYLNLGISRTFDKTKRPEWEIDELLELEASLHRAGYKRGTFWVGHRALFNLDEDEFYLEMSGNREILITSLADDFWNLFTVNQTMLESTNQALGRLVA
jgi:hypothetical protein